MTHNMYAYILIMAGVTFAIRALPLALIQKQIQNRFLKSFLYYVPYVPQFCTPRKAPSPAG